MKETVEIKAAVESAVQDRIHRLLEQWCRAWPCWPNVLLMSPKMYRELESAIFGGYGVKLAVISGDGVRRESVYDGMEIMVVINRGEDYVAVGRI